MHTITIIEQPAGGLTVMEQGQPIRVNLTPGEVGAAVAAFNERVVGFSDPSDASYPRTHKATNYLVQAANTCPRVDPSTRAALQRVDPPCSSF